MSEWDELVEWWVEESSDPAYGDDVSPLVQALTACLDGPCIDLGCGTGRLYDALPQPAFGCDSSGRLLAVAAEADMPVIQTRLPDLKAFRDGSFASAVACLVVEHLPNIHEFFAEAARIVRSDGHLVVVSNHPAYTSTGAGPLIDQSDGEVLWRWGTYFVESIAAEPAGEGSIVFHHRPLATIINSAAAAGWVLERMLEAGASEQMIARVPSLAGQDHMPRLIALRWRNATQQIPSA